MKALLGIVAAVAIAVPLYAAPGGRLDTLPHGTYVCSLPGDAAGEAWRIVEGREFTIGNGSSYRSAEGSGTYLLTGTTVRFTRGPMKGKVFERTGAATLRELDAEGGRGRLRCVRQSGSR